MCLSRASAAPTSSPTCGAGSRRLAVDGKDLQRVRSTLDLSQRQMGAVIGYSKSFVKMLETGKRTPPPGFGVHVAKKIRQWAADVTNTVTNEAEKIESQEESGNN